jgi:hypothetical protein
MHVGTYPTRNFAQLLLSSFLESWTLPCLEALAALRKSPLQFTDSRQAFRRQVITMRHHSHHITEHQKVLLLSCLEGVFFEERHDDLKVVLKLSHTVTHSIAVIASHDAAAKKLLNRVKNLNIALVLHDYEFRQYLHASSHFFMSSDTDVKTSFAVGEADHPLCIQIHLRNF